MACTVVKSPAVLITPAGPTTPGGVLPPSSIDRSIVSGLLAHSVQVFDPPPPLRTRMSSPVALLREGLARALVPYYPLAGRLTPRGPSVDCTGELGVWLVEAAASCDVDGVMDGRVSGELLVPMSGDKLTLEEGGAVVVAQVTTFSCGGVAVGVSFSHAVVDGHGAGQFLGAVGEHARGVAPSVAPVWARDALIPDIPRRPPKFVSQVVDISPESIARVKKEYFQLTKKKTCSTFDAVTAVVFKCRALALAIDDLDELRLGYFDPAPFPVDYGTVVVSDMRHLGFNDVDYGFGEPRYFFPPTHHLGFPNVYYVRPPKPKAGVRLVLRCVREPHAAAFAAELANFASCCRTSDGEVYRSRI